MNFCYGLATGFALCAILAGIIFAFLPPNNNSNDEN
jgi:cytochrome c biogenesis protein CcdA